MADDSEKVIRVVREQGVDYDANGEAIPWTEVYVKIKVAFRAKALKLLKGPKLSCFLCVALHVGEEGTAHPSIDTIMRETGYSRSVVCNALDELEELGFIEKQRRKHDSTLYHVRGYVWYGSESKPTLLGESQSSKNELSEPKSKGNKRLLSERLPNEPKDNPSSKDKPQTAKDNLDSGSKKPKVDPLLFEKERATLAARAEAGGNPAVPPSAGGSDALADMAIACLWGDIKKGSGTYDEMVNIFSRVHADWGLHDMEVGEALEMVEEAARLFKREKPDMAVYKYPSFAANYGNYLSQAKAGDAEAPDRHARYDMPSVRASQAALDERQASRPPPVKDDWAWAAAKRELELQMTKATFQTWVAGTVGLGQEDGVYRVAVRNEGARGWLEDRLKTTAQRTLVGILGEQVEVRFEVES